MGKFLPTDVAFTKLYINGEYVPSRSSRKLFLRNPKDDTLVCENVPIAGADDVDRAVEVAEKAFEGPWSKFSAIQRTECFLRLIALLEEHLVDIMTLDSLTTGNPVSLIPTREKNYVKNCLLYYGKFLTSKFESSHGTYR